MKKIQEYMEKYPREYWIYFVFMTFISNECSSWNLELLCPFQMLCRILSVFINLKLQNFINTAEKERQTKDCFFYRNLPTSKQWGRITDFFFLSI